MVLLFKKNNTGDVEVTMFKGTTEIPFSYIEVIRCLMAGEPINTKFDESVIEEERTQIECVMKEIETIAKGKEEGSEIM